MFFLSPEITCFFWKSATMQCGRWAGKNTCFFSNARPKSFVRAHLEQKIKNIVALRPVYV